MKIAIIGAGMAGVTAALDLQAQGHTVELFEKSRGPSGRMSTRQNPPWQADHGAQFFTAKSTAFQVQVANWCEQGIAALWSGTIANQGSRKPINRYVGVPRMNALVAALCKPLTLHLTFTLSAIQKLGHQWQLVSLENGPHPECFDSIIFAIPSPQLTPFMAHFPASWQPIIQASEYAPCWTIMAGYSTPLALPFDARFMDESVLSWVARNHSKPERTGPETWTLHASAAYSREHLEAEPESVTQTCLNAFYELGAPQPEWVQTHRWRYALANNTLAPADHALWDNSAQMGLCGDWLADGRIEGAWLSGKHCADRLLKHRLQ